MSRRRARSFRKSPTEAEKALWKHLRGKQFDGLKFRRQEPIGDYIIDFVCYQKRLIVEVDGGQHSSEKARDALRDEYLTGEGFKVLRFWNNQVLDNMDGVLEEIGRNC